MIYDCFGISPGAFSWYISVEINKEKPIKIDNIIYGVIFTKLAIDRSLKKSLVDCRCFRVNTNLVRTWFIRSLICGL